jgi:RNA repair, ligase-Pnkp-associating, region of Hen1
MLDYPACEMVASGSRQPHAADYPNHAPGTDLGCQRNKPLEATIEAVPPAVANSALGRCSNRFGYEIEATRHELDEKLPAVGASRLFTVRSRALRPSSERLTHLYVVIPVFASKPAALPAAAQK